MKEKKMYEAVSVEDELPPSSGEYFCIDPNGFIPDEGCFLRYDKSRNIFFYTHVDDVVHPSYWLREVSPDKEAVDAGEFAEQLLEWISNNPLGITRIFPSERFDQTKCWHYKKKRWTTKEIIELFKTK